MTRKRSKPGIIGRNRLRADAAHRTRVLERAGARLRRRRAAWLAATKDVRSFEAAITHPSWGLVEEANALLLALP